jgi:hypothetical protein
MRCWRRTRQEDLAQPERPKKIRGLTAEQMARMEREMDGLQREFKAMTASYGDTVLNLVVASGYLSSLMGNTRVSRYLERHHPDPQPQSDAKRTSKKQAVIAMLQRSEGATVDEVASATGWQRHTVRGLFSGTLKKKLGLTLVSAKEERGRVYRIAAPEQA